MIITLQQAVKVRESLGNDVYVVAACGCFDIFHIGHLEFLEGASQNNQVLFVGVNSDQSVIDNKGRPPVFCCKDRMKIVNALRCVNYVFQFSFLDFSQPLEQLRPNCFARGVDADKKGFPEEAIVKKLHIPVNVIGLKKRSSSCLLREYFR